MSVGPSRIRIGLVAALIGFAGFAAVASTAQAQMAGSFYQAQVKAGKSKGAASKATKAAMKGVKGFYGFKLKAKDIPAKNGTLIWAKRETGRKNALGASATYNILYSSKSFPGNRKTVISGTVMVPKGKAPKGGWSVISWAHGTVGIADQCAPSRRLGDTAYYGSESGQLVNDWLKAGYAVVATDYAGLGTPGTHPYLVGESEGRSVLDMVLAARQLDSRLSPRVALVGHSQGGQAILFAANLATGKWGKGANYLGTVSYAPASNLDRQVPLLSVLTSYGLSSLALTIVNGTTVANPAINARELLTEQAFELYPKTDTLCLSELTAEAQKADLKPGGLLKPGWNTTANGKRLEAELVKMNPAVKVGAPVLIPQGTSDETVLPAFTDILVGQLEPLNPGLVTYETFTGATHSSILLDSRTEVDQFLRGLFNP